MTLTIKPWNSKNFKDMPSFRLFPTSCKYCAYWESLKFDEQTKRDDAERMKRNWLVRVKKDFGNCGFIAYLDDVPVGFTQYAPPRYFPTISKYQNLSPHSEIIFLSCIYLPNRELRGTGIGKQLLERIVWDLQNRDYKSIETFVRLNVNPSNDLLSWLPYPLDFFIKMGFDLIKQRDQYFHLRKELNLELAL